MLQNITSQLVKVNWLTACQVLGYQNPQFKRSPEWTFDSTAEVYYVVKPCIYSVEVKGALSLRACFNWQNLVTHEGLSLVS